MYSQAQLIAALHKEIAILTHLADKITDAHHGHKFTDKQRTITELLAYLAASPAKQIEVIFTGDMNIFADMKDYTENFKPKHFVEELTKNMNHAIKLIENATEESLNEMVSLFGGFAVGTRGQLLVEVGLTGMVAYKMQLFLQMKHAGLHDLGTMNLWAGMDKAA